MIYVFIGFMLVVIIETFIRISGNYKAPARRETTRTQVSLPWYGWGLIGLLTFGLLKKRGK